MTKLKQGITLSAAFSLVAGSMIGTGVFLKTATMSQLLDSPGLVLLAWALAGILSLIGAFCYAEVGARFPGAGGEYVYLREAFGPFAGFLYGWTRLWIGSPASVAAYGVGAATFLSAVVSLENFGGRTVAALLLIWTFSLVNCLTIVLGARVQTLLTAVKIAIILFIGCGIFLFGESPSGWASVFQQGPTNKTTLGAFGMAMISALWAYDGWNNLPMASSEVVTPRRNIPLALITGTLAVFGLYLLINLAYFYVLPMDTISTLNSSRFPDAPSVASKSVGTFLGEQGTLFIGAAMVLSAVGAMNGSILTGARVPYAMALDGLLFKKFALLHPITSVPVYAILLQGAIATALCLSGTFDQLTEYVVFTSWIFYALVTFSIFRLRKMAPSATFKVPLFPLLPILFTVLSVTLLANTFWSSPRDSLFGLGFLALGVPAYLFFKKT